jgi:general secretion pathway protein K
MTDLRRRLRRIRRQDGYALVAAVVAVAAFSYVSLEVLASDRGITGQVGAESQRAKLTAAADAGIAMALRGLGVDDPASRWPIDGRPVKAQFAGMALTIVVEDERGKIPINDLNEDQVREMFSIAGVSGDRLDTLTDSFNDWTDEDDDRRPSGAEAPDYRPLGIKPRNGRFRSVAELIHLRGMDPKVLAKIAPAATVFFGESGGFSPGTAQPFALAVMTEGGPDSAEVIERQRELEGERPAMEEIDHSSYIGRIFTVRVSAADSRQGQVMRTAIVELTGNTASPVWIRQVDP